MNRLQIIPIMNILDYINLQSWDLYIRDLKIWDLIQDQGFYKTRCRVDI